MTQFFEKAINKIDVPVAEIINKKKIRTQINEVTNETGELTTNSAEI